MRRSFSLLAGLAGFAGLTSPAAEAAVTISSDPTQNMNCTGGVCTAIAQDAVLNVNDLTTMLAGGDVTVASGPTAMDIDVAAALAWANTHKLTLDAYRSMVFHQAVVVQGEGALSLLTDDGGLHGDFSFVGSGSVTFWDLTSQLLINASSYKLISDISTLAAGVSAKPKGHYALANDYDAGPDGTYADSPIPTLTGTFEGLGHMISNLTINVRNIDNPNDTVGLFVSVGRARDIGLANANLTVTLDADGGVNVGLLAGSTGVKSAITNVWASGNLTVQRGAATGVTSAVVGGISGSGEGSIANSHAVGGVTINGTDYAWAGGLVGRKEVGTISNSYASMDVTAHAMGTTIGASARAGGLVGVDHGTISGSYATGRISADAQAQSTGPAASAEAGGLVGEYTGDGSNSSISNVYATGAVQGNSGPPSTSYARVGGLIGFYDGSAGNTMVASAYSTGAVSGSAPGTCLGGLVGDMNDPTSVLANTYWDLDTSGITDPSLGVGCAPNYPGVTGLTTTQLRKKLPKGFKSNVWALDSGKNGGFPYLVATPPPQ